MFQMIKKSFENGINYLKNFYINNKKKIFLSLFLSSIHPHYLKFNYSNEENSNQIKNFITKEECDERNKYLSNIEYEIIFDFSENTISDENLNKFAIGGYISIKFYFDSQNFPKEKKYLKIDYQGKVESITLNSIKLKEIIDFYVEKFYTKDNFVVQEKDCIFINVKYFVDGANEILINFKKIFTEEMQTLINNPFLYVENVKISENYYATDFTFLSSEPYNLNRLFPCFDQPNFLSRFKIFYMNNNVEYHKFDLIVNGVEFSQLNQKEKDEIFKKLKFIDNKKFEIFQMNREIITHTNNISIIKSHLMSKDFNFEINSLNKENIKLTIFFEKNHDYGFEEFLTINTLKIKKLFERCFNWIFKYFEITTLKNKLNIFFMRSCNKTVSSNDGMIYINLTNLNPDVDIIENNYFYFILVNQIFSTLIHQVLHISWWEDAYILESMALFITNLFIDEKKYELSSNEETKYFELIFNNLKNRAYKLDSSPDSHIVNLAINNTEEAYNFFDEITIYKTTSIFEYLSNLNKELFKLFLKKLINQEIISKNRSRLFDRKIFIDELNLMSIRFKNDSNEDKILLNYKEIFEILTKNKGVTKIKINLKNIFNENKKNFYNLELIQTPLHFHETPQTTTFLYLMEVIDIMIFYSSGKYKNINVMLFPKSSNIYNLECESDDEIIGAFINTNDKNYLTQIIQDDLIADFKNNPSLKAKISKMLNNIADLPIARLVFLRDLFFSFCNREIDQLNSSTFVEILYFMICAEKNIFIKNELIKKYIFSVINYCQYYTVKEKEEFSYYKTIKIDNEIPFKSQSFDLLFILFDKVPELRKNLINYIIDLLYHFYNISTLDRNLLEIDDIKRFIKLLKRENKIHNKTDDKLKLSEFYKNIDYIDVGTKKRVINTIMILYSGQIKYFTYDSNQFGEFNSEDVIDFDQFSQDSRQIHSWKKMKDFWKKIEKLDVNKMNDDNFEKLFYLAKYIRNDNIKEGRIIKQDKFFKILINILNQNNSEYYKILFYKFLNPSYILTEKTLESYKKMRKKIQNDISRYLLYLIDYDIYYLENKLAILKHDDIGKNCDNLISK